MRRGSQVYGEAMSTELMSNQSANAVVLEDFDGKLPMGTVIASIPAVPPAIPAALPGTPLARIRRWPRARSIVFGCRLVAGSLAFAVFLMLVGCVMHLSIVTKTGELPMWYEIECCPRVASDIGSEDGSAWTVYSARDIADTPSSAYACPLHHVGLQTMDISLLPTDGFAD